MASELQDRKSRWDGQTIYFSTFKDDPLLSQHFPWGRVGTGMGERDPIGKYSDLQAAEPPFKCYDMWEVLLISENRSSVGSGRAVGTARSPFLLSCYIFLSLSLSLSLK